MAEHDANEVGPLPDFERVDTARLVVPRSDVPRLVAEHGEALYRFAYRLTGSPADAEDLTQQTFLIVHRKLDQIRDPARPLGWLMTVMRNCYVRMERKNRPHRTRAVSLEIDSLPAEVVERLEIDQEDLQGAIDQLPDDYKLVLLGFYFEGRSYREMAEELDVPLGTVMSRLARAKSHLRSRLFEAELQPAGRAIAARQPRGDA